MNEPAGSGVLVVDKPAGWTSHQVVGRVRRLLGTRKVGHAGTLDPMATGVLLVGVNRATRLLGHLMLTQKEYTATIRLGIGTLTDDADGEPTATPGAAGIDADRVRAALPAFTGDIDQVPTAVSAIKVDGKRSYARVRAGESVELAPRRVQVAEFALLDARPAEVDGLAVVDCDVRVRCSSGTYVRALARDLGAALGSAGHLTALRRTRVGPFGLDRAVDIDTDAAPELINMAEAAAGCFPTVPVDADAAADISHGRRLALELNGPAALLHGGELLAIYRPDGASARPVAVFAAGS
ncbi:tRNA pseudouridine(55) synthase TruB [Naumannella huperziae]